MPKVIERVNRVLVGWSPESHEMIERHRGALNMSRSVFFDSLLAGLTDSQIETALAKGIKTVKERRQEFLENRREIASVIKSIPQQELMALIAKKKR